MKIVKRGFTLAAALACSLALIGGTATAAITPDPYSTTSGTGSITRTMTLGPSTCWLSNITADLSGTADGAIGTISGFAAGGCNGLVVSMTYHSPIAFAVTNGVVTMTMPFELENILGGTCRYDSTLVGTMSNGSGHISVAGAPGLIEGTGYCRDPMDSSMRISLPGLSVTW